MKINYLGLIIIMVLCITGCKIPFFTGQNYRIGDTYIPEKKESWDIMMPYTGDGAVEVYIDDLIFHINFNTNYIIYNISTRDRYFSTQEGISPYMSYAQVKNVMKNSVFESSVITNATLFDTNIYKNFSLKLDSGWSVMLKKEYDISTSEPVTNDYVSYIYKDDNSIQTE